MPAGDQQQVMDERSIYARARVPNPVLFEAVFENRADAERAAKELDESQLDGVEFRVTLPEVDAAATGEQESPGVKTNVQGATTETPEAEVRKFLEQVGPLRSLRSYEDLLFGQVTYNDSDVAIAAREAIDGSRHFGQVLRAEVDCCSDWMNRVLLHGIGKNTSWNELKEFCQDVGTDPGFTCIHGGRTAFVELESHGDALKALNANKFLMTGADRPLDVAFPYDEWKQSTRVRVRHLPDSASHDQVAALFKGAGRVMSVDIRQQELPPEFLHQRGKWYKM